MMGVTAVGGEPRCLQLYLDDGVDAQLVAGRWSEDLGDVAYVATRSEMIALGWFGPVGSRNLQRIGDILVLARKDVVFFDARDQTNKARNMVGHHGGISPAEMKIPLLQLT
jgi:hypothetical protein